MPRPLLNTRHWYVPFEPDQYNVLACYRDLSCAQRRRRRRADRGLCQRCNQPPVPGRTLCAAHAAVATREGVERHAAVDALYRELYGMSRYRLARLRRLPPSVQYWHVVG